eukprot:Cvel_35589.t1-p1 / transcript=Cvel_35589.t1 / gene=Cvel_35589 / organism=Chromera_velia_CCMP2878 / gene_product=hypothetical protein / transcript_product=hypothetical protein / location=Cvel_scaffold6565:1381-2281(+) / protein_length=113 / sequence_SO=supercontig / SO=protein_coding / is_pseudo=false
MAVGGPERAPRCLIHPTEEKKEKPMLNYETYLRQKAEKRANLPQAFQTANDLDKKGGKKKNVFPTEMKEKNGAYALHSKKREGFFGADEDEEETDDSGSEDSDEEETQNKKGK